MKKEFKPGELNKNNSVVLSQPDTILPQHLEEWVVGSAVNEDIARLNVRSMDADTAAEQLGFGKGKLPEGWWVSGVSSLTGRQKNPPFGQFKPDVPFKTKDGAKPAKYLTAKGQSVDAIWLAMPEDNYWANVIANSDKILITEGAKKAGAGLSVDLPTVAVTGVWNWVEKDSGELAPWLRDFVSETPDKTYYIAFDSDYGTKPQCFNAIISLGKALKKAGIKKVFVLTWDDRYKGMDDYIKANGGDEFKKRVDVAMRIEQWEKQFRANSDNDTDNSKKRRQQNPKTVADEIVEFHRCEWAFHNEQKVWRIWNGKYWEEIDSDAFSQVVLNELEVKEVEIKTPAFLKNVVDFLKLKLLVKKWKTFDLKRYIPFSNGVLDLQENKLLPHDTGYRFTHCLDRSYSPIESSGDILADLKRHHPHGYDYIMGASGGRTDAALKMLAVIAGIIKWRFSALQKFIYIQGKPRSGKGTFVRLITEIIGRNNVESSCLGKLSSEYEVAEIIDSQLVVFPDEDKQGGGYSVFKKLTGGDELRYRQIYGKPGKGTFSGSILISSNGSIFAGDATGIKERQCTLIFDNQVDEGMRSPLFEERLHQDIDKLLAVALTMPDDEADSRIKGLHDASAVMYREREWQLRCDVSGVAAFIEEKLKPSKDNFIPSAKLYEGYAWFCSENNYGKTHNSRMTGELINTINSYLHWEGVTNVTKRVDGKPTKVIMGVAFRKDEDIFVSQGLATKADGVGQSTEPLPHSAVTLPPVTAEPLPQETTENQGFEPSVTAVTAEVENSNNSKFEVDWGEDEPVQLDLMAQPEPELDRTDEIVDRLTKVPDEAAFGDVVKTHKPSQLKKAHDALIGMVNSYPDNRPIISRLLAIKYWKENLDKKVEKEKEDHKKRAFLDKLANKARTGLSSNVEIEINNRHYQCNAQVTGKGDDFDTYKVFPLEGYSMGTIVRLDEITIPDEAWGKVK